MENEKEKAYVEKIFNLARMQGLIRTQRDFAQALGVNPSTMSMAIAGRESYLTPAMIMRVRLYAKENNLDAEPQQQDQQRGVFVPEELRAMFENMTETIKLQAQMLSAQQAAQQSHGLGGYFGQKNYYREGDQGRK